jgi:hypothetical protein
MGLLIICILTSVVPSQPLLWMFMGRIHGLKPHTRLGMIDYFTKAAEFAVVYTRTPAAVARAFYYSWVCRYFVPPYVNSDNGTEFSEEFVHLLKRLLILLPMVQLSAWLSSLRLCCRGALMSILSIGCRVVSQSFVCSTWLGFTPLLA